MHEEFWQRVLAAEIPSHRCRGLLEDLGNFSFGEEALAALKAQLTPGEFQAMERADMQALQRAVASGVYAIGYEDFPEPLASVENGPPAIFVKGRPESLKGPNIGIVGTRNVSTYGKACALKYAEAFADAGATVVSGGALGIDAAAHEGALSKNGRTLAVLGTGVDMVYPAAHRGLFDRIIENGALVSQFAVGTRAMAYRFPIRNHLIAALSDAVVVIEAPGGSGALITASAAAEMGRQVFVVPSNITHPGFRGSHALIRDGAALTDHPDQVLDSVGIASPLELTAGTDGYTPSQRTILDVLAEKPLRAETLASMTGLPADQLLSDLTELELSGVLLRDGGLYAVKRI